MYMAKSKNVKHKRKHSLLITLAFIAFLVYFTVTIISARSDIKEKQDEVNQLSSQCETVENENKELQNNLDNGDKEDYIERIAREKYGYIKPGDRVYVISFDQNGEVLTAPDKNKEVMVQMGIMKMKVPMAELMPSKELALIKPAASPMRKIPFSHLQKSRKDEGRSTRHASVFKGAPKRNPISSSFAFCRSKRSLA